MLKLIGLLGGTFNPIHFGHLRLAQELANNLHFDEVRFIPSANPPHKTIPVVSASHRARMVEIAIAGNSLFKSDTQELMRLGASYTIDTLISIRAEIGDAASLCLIMGSDAFTNLNTWHRWQELLDYCHIILVHRPNKTVAPDKLNLTLELETFLQENYTQYCQDLSEYKAGFIHMQPITAHEISSTAIREQFKQGQQPQYLMPIDVIEYIVKNNLYV